MNGENFVIWMSLVAIVAMVCIVALVLISPHTPFWFRLGPFEFGNKAARPRRRSKPRAVAERPAKVG